MVFKQGEAAKSCGIKVSPKLPDSFRGSGLQSWRVGVDSCSHLRNNHLRRPEFSRNSAPCTWSSEARTTPVDPRPMPSTAMVCGQVQPLLHRVLSTQVHAPHQGHVHVCTHAGVFLACGVEDEETGSGLVQVAYLRNLAAPTLSLSTPLQRRPITALCLGQGSIGRSRGAVIGPAQHWQGQGSIGGWKAASLRPGQHRSGQGSTGSWQGHGQPGKASWVPKPYHQPVR